MRKEFGIKELLRERQLSMKDLAEMLAVHPVSLSNILRNNPTIDTLVKIANLLNCNLVDLFESSAREGVPNIIGRWENYRAEDIATFRKLEGENGILSNMYKVELNLFGHKIESGENLYIAGRFEDIELQRWIISHKNPSGCKRECQQYKHLERSDWKSINIEYMKFCIALKYQQSEEFRNVLHSTGNKIIVEDSSLQTGFYSYFWGAKDRGKRDSIAQKRKELKEQYTHVSLPKTKKEALIAETIAQYYPTVGNGIYEGCNTMGKLLTMLRGSNGKLKYTLPDNLNIMGHSVNQIML